MTTIVRSLERLRRRARAVLVAERTAVILAFALAALSAWVALDAMARFPMAIRLAALAIGVCALAIVVVRWWLTAARFRPPLTELALRVERRRPELAGELASSVEFQSRSPRGALESRAIERTERLAGAGDFSEFVRRDRLVRALVGVAAAAAIPLVVIIVDPTAASIGARRALLPWTGAEWPARTMVRSLMDDVTHLPRGGAILLRAEATRGDPVSMRPFVRYRLFREGVPGPWREAALAHQQDGIFERPLDADADAIDFQFGTADAMTEIASIELVTPPAVRAATLTAQPPAYAAGTIEARHADLGNGTDARGILAAPILAGSSVEIDIELTSRVPVPLDPERRDAWSKETFGAEWPEGAAVVIDQIEASDDADGGATEDRGESAFADDGETASVDRVRLRAVVREDWDIPILLRDAHGISSEDGARFRVPVTPDRAPSATVVEPAEDEVVLPTASIRLVAEGRDDVAIDELGLRIDRNGAEPNEKRERVNAESGAVDWTLTPESIGAGAGDVLLVSAVATDAFEENGTRRGETVSPPRRIRVVGEEEFTRQVRAQLASVRQSAIRAEATQREIAASADPEEGAPSPAADQARRQAQLSDRIRAMRDAVASLEARARAGGLEREALGEIMRQAQELLGAAGAASADAAAQLAERAAAEARAAEAGGDAEARERAAAQTAEAAELAQAAQEETSAELEDLVRLLDRDEDAWIATRRIERLAADIERLVEETRRTGERTVGRDLESLSAEERLELDRLSGRDRTAAQEARETLEELRDRAERLAEADRARAAGMREAARRGEERNVARRLEEAAERMAQNQPTNAEQSLQDAADAARSMMEAIQDDRRSRVDELRRRLATLEESLRALVEQANASLDAVRALATDEGGAAAVTSASAGPVAAGVVALDRNIGAATDEARSGQGTERSARLLERAGERSAVSAARLRAEPPEVVAGEEALDRSRGLLVEALEQVREQRRQAESQQAEMRRRELAASLRELSERQAGLRTASEGLVGAVAADRRRLVEGRRLSVEQQVIRSALGDLKRSHEEIASSELFESASGRLDEWMRRSVEHLAQVSVTRRTLNDQSLAAETLAMMGQALADRSGGDDPFAEAAGGGNQGAGGAGGEGAEGQNPGNSIPPVAELRLLRETQAQLARRTRVLDETEAPPAERGAELKELARLQQELMEHGQAWIDRVKRQSQGGGEGIGEGRGEGGGEAGREEGGEIEGGIRPPAPPGPSAPPLTQAPAPPSRPSAPSSDTPSTPPSDAPSSAPEAPPIEPPSSSPPSPAPRAAPRTPRTLDDLLGITPTRPEAPPDGERGEGDPEEGADPEQRGAAGMDEAQRDRLRRSLNEEELADTFVQAVESMRRSMERLGVQSDSGIETQRIQEDAVRRLDALIDAARRIQQRQQQQASSSQRGQQNEEQPSENADPSARRPGDRRQAASRSEEAQASRRPQDGQPEPPELKEGELNEVMSEGRVEWGNLPPRVRDLVQQGRRDRVSSLYQRLTEEYYRRMAEEASR